MSRINRSARSSEAAQHRPPNSCPTISDAGHVNTENLRGVTPMVTAAYRKWLKRRGLADEPTPSNLGRQE